MKTLSILILIFISSLTYCQENIIRGIIIDKDTKQPLEYACISWITDDQPIGAYSNENGYFELLSRSDTCLISFVGYKSQLFFREYHGFIDTIYLETNTIQINEVTVSTKSKTKRVFETGLIKKKADIKVWPKSGWEFALYIPNNTNEELKFIKEIRVSVNSVKGVEYMDADIRVHLYELGLNDSPGKELLRKNIIYTVKKNDELVAIDVSDEMIEFKKNGIFVGVEFIGITEGNDNSQSFNFNFTSRYKGHFMWTRYMMGKEWVKFQDNDLFNFPDSLEYANAIWGIRFF